MTVNIHGTHKRKRENRPTNKNRRKYDITRHDTFLVVCLPRVGCACPWPSKLSKAICLSTVLMSALSWLDSSSAFSRPASTSAGVGDVNLTCRRRASCVKSMVTGLSEKMQINSNLHRLLQNYNKDLVKVSRVLWLQPYWQYITQVYYYLLDRHNLNSSATWFNW